MTRNVWCGCVIMSRFSVCIRRFLQKMRKFIVNCYFYNYPNDCYHFYSIVCVCAMIECRVKRFCVYVELILWWLYWVMAIYKGEAEWKSRTEDWKRFTDKKSYREKLFPLRISLIMCCKKHTLHKDIRSDKNFSQIFN